MKELKKVWDRQKKFNEIVNGKIKTLDEKQAITKEFILHAQTELVEILNCINWKSHREKKYDKYEPIKISNVKEECIDSIKYIISIMQFWGMSASDFIEEFNKKSEIVELRYKQEMQLNLLKSKKIAAIDLDGVLVDYPSCLFDYIERKNKKNVIAKEGDKNVNESVLNYLSEEKAKKIKYEYRMSGEKRTLKKIKNVEKVISLLKEKGYKIVILSSRPYKEYPRIFSDTLFWLNKNNIKYDAVLFDENKENKIIEKFPNMKFMVEDDGDIALRIAKRGYKVFLIDNIYNKHISHKKIKRIKHLEEVLNG